MLILFIAIASAVFFASLLGYKKVRSKNASSKVFQWIAWIVFCLWILGFTIGGMSVIQNNFSDTNKVVAIIPVALAFIVFLIIYRKELVVGGFNKNGR